MNELARWSMNRACLRREDPGSQARFDDQPTAFDIPITGGTEGFDNVRGFVHIDPVSNNVSDDTLTLIP